MSMEEVILTSIKKLLGIADEDDHFDTEITIQINTAIMSATMLGIGPEKGFTITKESKWTEFVGDRIDIEGVKTYIYMKVRQAFDPPATSYLIESINKQITELEWKLVAQVEAAEDKGGQK